MPEINQLSTLDELSAGDLFPVYSNANSDARKVSASNLAAFVGEQLAVSGAYQKQYFAPNATGFSVTVSPINANNVYLLMTPAAGYAAGTIVLPASPQESQRVLVSSTQSVSTLTVSGNGATVNGSPTALTANGFFELIYDQILSSWYRVG